MHRLCDWKAPAVVYIQRHCQVGPGWVRSAWQRRFDAWQIATKRSWRDIWSCSWTARGWRVTCLHTTKHAVCTRSTANVGQQCCAGIIEVCKHVAWGAGYQRQDGHNKSPQAQSSWNAATAEKPCPGAKCPKKAHTALPAIPSVRTLLKGGLRGIDVAHRARGACALALDTPVASVPPGCCSVRCSGC